MGTGQLQAEHPHHPGPGAHDTGQAPRSPRGVATGAGQQAWNCFPGVNHCCQESSRKEARACPSWCWCWGMVREDFPQEVILKLRALGLSGRGMQEGRPGRPLTQVVGWQVAEIVHITSVWLGPREWESAGRWQGWACAVSSRLSLPGQTGREESAAAAGCAEVSGSGVSIPVH